MRDDLPHAMRETARQLEPDVVRLAAGGVSRGTRMRRVERVVQVLGSVLAVVVVFAGVVLVGSHRTSGAGTGLRTGVGAGGASGGGLNQPAASGGASPGETRLPETPSGTAPGLGTSDGTGTSDGATPGVDVRSAQTPSSTGVPQISANELIGILESGLEGTGVTGDSYQARGTESLTPVNMMPMNSVMVSARLTAQRNIGSISIVISGSRNLASIQGVPQTIGDGSLVYVSQIPTSSEGSQGNRLTLDVTLVRPNHSTLTAIETNSSDEKSAAAPGAPLLLTSDQVTALLDGPVWDDAVAAAEAMPPPAGASATSP